MGGHGGLNILPQKRWNVYNRDNRLKVSQDEAKARAEEEAAQQQADRAEAQFRHQYLLKKARGHDADYPEQVAEGVAAEPSVGTTAPVEHINFWREDESKMKEQHPEVQAAAKDEARKRGKADMYTSDAKFDERFQFAYGVKGSEPWYVKKQQHAENAITSEPDPFLRLLDPAPPKAEELPPPLPATASHRAFLHHLPSQLAASKTAQSLKQRELQGGNQQQVDEVQAAKAFLKQALGADALAGLDTSSSDDDDSSSSSSSSSDSSSSSSSEEGDEERKRKKERGRKRKRRKRTSDSGSESPDNRDSKRRQSSGQKKDRHKRSSSSRKESSSSSKRKRKDKKERRSKSKRHRRDKGQDGDDAGRSMKPARSPQQQPLHCAPTGLKSVEQLRLERLGREAAERQRATQVLVGVTDFSDMPGHYNSSFGYAAGLLRRQR